MWQALYRMVNDSSAHPSAVGGGFEFRSGQTKDYKTGICYFSAKHTLSMSKSKDLSF
jgi:hypothetical protein